MILRHTFEENYQHFFYNDQISYVNIVKYLTQFASQERYIDDENLRPVVHRLRKGMYETMIVDHDKNLFIHVFNGKNFHPEFNQIITSFE